MLNVDSYKEGRKCTHYCNTGAKVNQLILCDRGKGVSENLQLCSGVARNLSWECRFVKLSRNIAHKINAFVSRTQQTNKN